MRRGPLRRRTRERDGPSRTLAFPVEVVLLIIAGGALALFTGVAILGAEHGHLQATFNGTNALFTGGPSRNGVLLRIASTSVFAAPNAPREAVYWQALVAGADQRMTGCHDGVVRFPAAGAIPNDVSWPLPMGAEVDTLLASGMVMLAAAFSSFPPRDRHASGSPPEKARKRHES